MKTIVRDGARESAKLRQQRLSDPLGFLHRPTTGAAEAANRILGDEDLILAAAGRFGQQSPEFNMLRQVWVQRILQGTLKPGERLEKVSEEVQRIMFPGTTLEQMRLLAKDMDFLMSSRASKDTAKSMAAVSHVEHPLGMFPLGLGKVVKVATLGMGDPIARGVLGGYFKMVRNISNNPAFMRWVQKGLNGDDRARDMVRQEVQKRMTTGGAVGAGVGELTEQNLQ
jgi:hypothetical protein